MHSFSHGQYCCHCESKFLFVILKVQQPHLGGQCFVKLKAHCHSKVARRLCDCYKKW